MTKIQMTKIKQEVFEHSKIRKFEFVSNFVLRISSLKPI